MIKIFVAVLLNILLVVPCLATPVYAGLQIGDNSAGVILGYQIDPKYAIEAHAARSNSTISHASVSVDTSTTHLGIAGISLFPMKLNEALPYFLLAKAGWERSTNDETYTIPNAVSLLDSGRVTSRKNQFIFGGGAEYVFPKNIEGRVGVDFVGKDKSINLAAVYKF